jgi:chromate transporter
LFLYLEFFKIGLFAVGGGLATLPFLFYMTEDRFTFIQQTGWLSADHVSNFIAIGQSSPGAIGVNIVAQTGFLYGGTAGGVLAVLGLVSPAFIIIAAVAKALQSLKENKVAASVFSGLRPAAAGILCAAGWGVWKIALYNPNGTANGTAAGMAAGTAAGAVWHEVIRWREGLVCIVLFLLIVKFRAHPVVYVALGAAAGIMLKF